MPTKAALVSALLCCIIQVHHLPCALAYDGVVNTLLLRIVLKNTKANSTSDQFCDAAEIVNLTGNALLSEATVEWSQKDTSGSPDVKYRVTTTGVDKIVSENHYAICGLASDTSYDVTVTTIDENGADCGVPQTINVKTNTVSLTAPVGVGEALVAKWDPLGSACCNITGYQVTLSEVGGAQVSTSDTEEPHYIFSDLSLNTAYQALIQPLHGSGQTCGSAAVAQQTTQNIAYSGVCAFPALDVFDFDPSMFCVQVAKSGPFTGLVAGNALCMTYPILNSKGYGAMYRFNPSYIHSFEDVLNYISLLGYTEELMVNGFWANGWKWGLQSNTVTYVAVDPALLVDVPAGGDGPDDYKYLYLDPAKDFGLSAAKERHTFKAALCVQIITM